jgi:hypothetical protein
MVLEMLVLPVSVTAEMIRVGNAESMMVANLSRLQRVSVSVVVETNILLIKELEFEQNLVLL